MRYSARILQFVRVRHFWELDAEVESTLVITLNGIGCRRKEISDVVKKQSWSENKQILQEASYPNPKLKSMNLGRKFT